MGNRFPADLIGKPLKLLLDVLLLVFRKRISNLS